MASGASADPTSVRRWNERAVLAVVDGGGTFRVSEVAARTGLTAASVRDVLRTLADKGWVEPVAVTQGGVGRPARIYRAHSPDAHVLGLDIGGHAVRCLLIDADGAVAHRREASVAASGDAVVAIRAAVAEVLASVDADAVWATGVAVSGALDAEGRVLRSIAVPALEGHRPADVLADLLPGSVQTWHDTKAALWAENIEGSARGERDVLLLSLGLRPSMALLLDGELHRGAHGYAGELSLNELIPAASEVPRSVDEARQALLGLAPQVAFAVGLVDPGVVVVGGALAPLAEPVLADFAHELGRRLEAPPRVVGTDLDQFAAARGALHLSRRHVWGRLVDGTHGVLPLTRESILGGHPARTL